MISNPQVNETPLPPADPARLMLFLGSLKSKSANGPRGTVRCLRGQSKHLASGVVAAMAELPLMY